MRRTAKTRKKIIMRPSIKRSLTGLLIVGVLAYSAVGADAMGGGNADGPDAFIGIIGGSPRAYGYSAGGGYQGGGFEAMATVTGTTMAATAGIALTTAAITEGIEASTTDTVFVDGNPAPCRRRRFNVAPNGFYTITIVAVTDTFNARRSDYMMIPGAAYLGSCRSRRENGRSAVTEQIESVSSWKPVIRVDRMRQLDRIPFLRRPEQILLSPSGIRIAVSRRSRAKPDKKSSMTRQRCRVRERRRSWRVAVDGSGNLFARGFCLRGWERFPGRRRAVARWLCLGASAGR